MLGLGLVLFTVKSLRPNLVWPERTAALLWSGWSLGFIASVVTVIT